MARPSHIGAIAMDDPMAPHRRLKTWIRRRVWPYVQFVQWHLHGRPAPPPHIIKRREILALQRAHGVRVLVETGTCFGDMVDFARRHFDRVFSIEIDEQLHRRAAGLFAGDSRVELLLGDSAVALPALLERDELQRQPLLYWLDGHYSGGVTGRGGKDTPVAEELAAVLARDNPGDIILIDDARCFDGTNDYPALDDLVAALRLQRPNMDVRIEHDMIKVVPRR